MHAQPTSSFSRRDCLQATGALALLTLAGAPARAATFPTRALRIVVPNAPGGGADLTARAVAQHMAGPLGQSLVIENKPSAGGVVAGEQVSRAAPDGHTLLLVSSGSAVSQALFKKLPFDIEKDFAPVSQLARFDIALAAAANGRFKTLADLLDYARKNPGKLNIGTPQIGTTQHLAAELFKLSAGIDAQVVPFNGSAPVINALRGGEIDVQVDIIGALVAQFDGKALLPLAVMGRSRAPQLPNVPTVRESGGPLADFDVSSWNGLAVPAKTPPEVVERLSREVQAAVAKPEVQKQLAALHLTAQGSTPAELRQHLAADIQRWRGVIERAKIQKL